MSGYLGRSEPPHVAQQSRRDKLRASHDLVQVRDIYDPAVFSSSSTMLDFQAHGLASQEAPFANPSSSGFHDRAGDPHSPFLMKGDWIMGCMGGNGGVSTPTHSPMFPSHLYSFKHGVPGYHDSQQPGELSSQDHLISTSPFCHNALQEVITSSKVPTQDFDMSSMVVQHSHVRESWVDSGNELLLLPNFGGLSDATRLDSTSVWTSRRPQQQWNGAEDLGRSKIESSFATAQGLSLSLSSNPHLESHVAQFEEGLGQEGLAATARMSMNNIVGFSSPSSKFSITTNRGNCRNTLQQGIVGSLIDTRPAAAAAARPLGPFTGYATILKSSKFLKPAQQLLDEICGVVTGAKVLKHCDIGKRGCGSVSVDCDAGVPNNGVSMRGISGASSSSFYSSTDQVSGESTVGIGAAEAHPPEFHQKKMKLLYMQDEVCRRYKQYHQQMQMVVSSFECVAGLSAATPYTSMALKAMSKNFRCLKNAISDQLQCISKVIGEEFMSSPSSGKGGEAMTTPKLKFIDPSLRKPKAAGDNSSTFMDHNPPVWRPQRGLPERSVAVLRSWLFEHFLHPYPTDTDKHMLATQTGLSRNQVSNWFINARVRLWKPMVEEIHNLEIKGITQVDLNSANKNVSKIVSDEGGQSSANRRSEGQTSKQQPDCSSMGSVPNEGSYHRSMEQWHHDKRSRLEECVAPSGMGERLMSFYQGGMDIGGLGPVSLTLGLRHNEGAAGSQQQQMRHFGSQMVHDFVG